MINKVTQIAEHFGIENQKAKLKEEVGELLEAIDEGEIEHITEEFADVLVVMLGIMVHYGLRVERIYAVMQSKIKRTLYRIETGYYDE